MIDILKQALESPFKTKSNFARENADLIAMAASDGFITTRMAAGLYSRKWMITPVGLSHYYALTGLNHD
ncbi:hypothetical protein SAMN02927900_04774 [Rhizobium mongolense subsp. loessense]|uniref:Uncharacterized protein n=1 Tax=Rhizobium mongolense subsp. loessense TaxID=158890 RepID=A0A1G4T784_9HYPH|nr:hypothetical protein [Rhizobium mongolense]SCW77141.1 hypothetical protein SAMN02927900_04774 [Rhizobium mongolense subsp. loessense]